MDEASARRLIIEIGRLLYERSYVVSSDGNLSIRLDDNRVLATPTGVSKGRMNEEMLAVTDLDGKPLNDRRASSELLMHLLVYRERSDVRAVCHAHPPHGTAFAVAGLSIDQPILSEVILTLGCVPLAAYGTPSTAELTDALQPFVKHHNALLMANHGAVAYGSDLWQAFDRMETLEHTARITILSRILGGGVNLPSDAIEKLINVRERAGYLTETARCQSCAYLAETGVTCGEHTAEPNNAATAKNTGVSHSNQTIMQNGDSSKVSLTREELIELLAQAAAL